MRPRHIPTHLDMFERNRPAAEALRGSLNPWPPSRKPVEDLI
jgi:hypothetical protein